MVKKILVGIVMLVVIMQLLQPTRNISEGPSENDISRVYAIPENVQHIFETKCYDCHSNNTRYPWYIHIQPIGWWMASHIKDAKDELNFSEFKTYNAKRSNHKLQEIAEVVTEGEMPLKSYIWLHADAKVTPEEVKAINDWT
ncbi:MAG TPA: heme-binding domain-containing protein, partial [Cyclobacteriaceae bacterium]